MAEIVRETVRTEEGGTTAPVKAEASGTQTMGRLVYFVFGILEVLLVFRLVFKLAGASTSSAFVRMIYSITGIFILPFEGIFRRGIAQGVETTSVLEPSTIVALIVYILIAWGIVKLIGLVSGEREQAD